MVNAYAPGSGSALDPADEALIARRTAVLGSPYRLFYRDPVHVVRGSGAHLFGPNGEDYLDAYNNVPSVGHANPAVQAAVAAQLGELNTHTRYLTDGVVEYAERLTAKFPSPLDQVVFACTGSEAVDLALRIARRHTGREGIIVTRNAYHGTTAAAAEISPSLGPGNPIPDRVVLVDAPDPLRGETDPAAAEDFAARVRDAIAELERRGVGLAGMIVDSALTSDGLWLEPAGFLARAAAEVRAAGGLYIADEVQPGFGRLGDWWGFTRHGFADQEFVPDLVVLGKPMGNGIPISAVVGSADLFDEFGGDVRYFNTFGGNPVSIAAASAVLDEIEGRGLIAHASAVGDRLRAGLREIQADAERAGSGAGLAAVRGAGLFVAADLVAPGADHTGAPASAPAPDGDAALAVVNGLRERRILVSASGRAGSTLKIRPPLVFDDRDADRFLDGFAEVMRELG
ncbi:aminotransferase class III-fold pyridoxal phosphate-dependent enzyme [Leucobacter sp. CSA2]|uniref:Aminotransferase class III-fold pyridoxal phosphate-dependent enzyme n=2 Tax=Leucobacter edaphi TaxID=2796472 RepID=A0A934QAD9_9MICO|nr:aminotransferase class III-fold pyridoxal phosphate-dependent enzyme [Leucobacter edaphi]